VFYLLDVAGHGIPAAMTSVTLFKILSPSPNVGRPLRYFLPDPPRYEVMNPSESVTDLNQRFQDKQNAMQYFTMVYGVIHCASNEVRMTQAGHPSPILIQKNTSAVTIGTGGFPVGMLPHVEYDEEAFQLNSGDRLFLYSDGVTECLNQKGEQFSEARLVKLLEDNIHLPLRDLLTIVDQSLHLWNGKPDFEDDVTLLAIEKR
jgi:sigma-B regulation protein RsbU (phosphoserine phosphatase)